MATVKWKAHIPTVQYGFVEVEVDGTEEDFLEVIKDFEDSTGYGLTGKAGTTPKE